MQFLNHQHRVIATGELVALTGGCATTDVRDGCNAAPY